MEIFEFQKSRYESIIEQRIAAVKDGIVFFGDSLLEWYDINKYLPEITDGYNCALRGATTKTLLEVMQECVVLYEPKTVVILVGTNDFGKIKNTTPQEVSGRLENIVNHIIQKLPKTNCIVISTIPVQQEQHKSFSDTHLRNELLKTCNGLLEQQLTSERVTFLNVYESFEVDGELDDKMTVDGLHLNQVGYKKLTGLIKDTILQIHQHQQ